MWIAACAPSTTSPPADSSAAPVEVTDLASYLAACEAELGPWPQLDCRDTVEVPITVTNASGTTVVTHTSQLEDGAKCDRSSIGGCAPGTRVGVAVNERGANTFFACRSYNDSPGFDEINVVWTLPETGATCFFGTPPEPDRYGEGHDLPRPGSPEDVAFGAIPFWKTLEDLQGGDCLSCHDNDPVLRNPWIEQTGIVPPGNPLGPYHLVAHDVLQAGVEQNWQPPRMVVHPDAAACLQCHRIGEGRSCRLALEATNRDPRGLTTRWFVETWPINHWMPSHDPDQLVQSYPTEQAWEEAFGLAADTLAACCSDAPPEGCFE